MIYEIDEVCYLFRWFIFELLFVVYFVVVNDEYFLKVYISYIIVYVKDVVIFLKVFWSV